jgi:hypothetical protein
MQLCENTILSIFSPQTALCSVDIDDMKANRDADQNR